MTDVRIDLEPAARQMAALADGVEDAALGDPTPCEQFAVRDLLQHVIELSVAFRDAARKDTGSATGAPTEERHALGADWRAQLSSGLEGMVRAWRSPEAWEGRTSVGGLTLDAQDACAVGLDELVVHGWDLARATGQDFVCDEESLRTVHALLSGQVSEDGTQGIFGPVAAVAQDAPLLDRVVALTGRDPGWTPAQGRL